MHWAVQYLGKPWKDGAVGPDFYDCWGLAVWVLREHFNTPLPPRPAVLSEDDKQVVKLMFGKDGNSSRWKAIEKPVDGCLVAMAGSKYSRLHVGVYLDVDGGKVLHCQQGKGTVAQSLDDLRFRDHTPLIHFLQYHGNRS